MEHCAVCLGAVSFYSKVDGFSYWHCSDCGFLQLDAQDMARVDSGEPLVAYRDGYWNREIKAARERAYSVGVARAAEAILLCRRQVNRFLDIGSGPGLLLDALAQYLPTTGVRFDAVELFPPPPEFRTTKPNYHIGELADFAPASIDAGICVEVLEHLTPSMVTRLLQQLAKVAADDACFVINTGLVDYVRDEDPGYIDPTGRGHISIWTVAAINHLARPLGLTATAIPGRSWCFILDKTANATSSGSVPERLRSASAANRQALAMPGIGTSAVLLLAEASMRESAHFANFLERTQWALQMKAELAVCIASRAVPEPEPAPEPAPEPEPPARSFWQRIGRH